MTHTDDPNGVGSKILRVRLARGQTLRVTAGLAGMDKNTLSRIERNERDITLKELAAIADALQIAPSDLTALPVPAPANGHTDSTIEAIRLTINAIEIGQPNGVVCPIEVLRDRVMKAHQLSRSCRFTDISSLLPALIRDVHTTLLTGSSRIELLLVAVYLHTAITRMWLNQAGAPSDLRSRIVFLTRRLAWEHGDPAIIGMAVWGSVETLTKEGAFDLAFAELDNFSAPSTTATTAGLLCSLAVSRAVLAEAAGRSGEAVAALDGAADMSGRFGELGWSDPLGFGFGPTNVDFRRARVALEAGEPDLAVRIAEKVNFKQNPFPLHHLYHFIGYGRALAQLRGRENDAIMALRRAELIHPHRVHRDLMVRNVITQLLARSRRVAVNRELRGMAYRAGLYIER